MNPQDEGGGSPPRCAPMELLWRGHCGSSSPGPAPRDRRNPLSLPVGFFPAAAVVALLLLAASGGVFAQDSPSPPQTPQAPPGYYNAGECEPAETGGVQNAEAIHPILSSLRSDPHISMCDAIFECPLLMDPSPPPWPHPDRSRDPQCGWRSLPPDNLCPSLVQPFTDRHSPGMWLTRYGGEGTI